MSTPVVAIVGRPNVGKSTLFNTLAGRRIAIVEPTSGVTRDRISTIITGSDGRQLELVDTGGMGAGPQEMLTADVEEQIQFAIARATVLVLVVDARDGLVPQDREIAARLRRLGKPVITVANKTETQTAAVVANEFHQLGLGDPLSVSAKERINTAELRERLFELAVDAGPVSAPPAEIKIALVGRRNVGKSTFINALANEKRVIVNELPGTTRDAVDVRFEMDGKALIAIDTAGLRKKRQVADSIEFYSLTRAEESIRRCDVVLFLFDARRAISQVEKRLARYISAHYKPSVIVVNKWDLAEGVATEEFVTYFSANLPGLAEAPMCFASALGNRRVRKAVEVARTLWNQARQRVRTAEFNTIVEELRTIPLRSAKAGQRPKVYYATQVGVAPPTIVLFVNSPSRFSVGYRKAIASFLRRRLPFPEVPIHIKYKRAEGRRG